MTLQFDIERMEREMREDREIVARFEAHQRALDGIYRELEKRMIEHLSAPWKALAADIRAASKASAADNGCDSRGA